MLERLESEVLHKVSYRYINTLTFTFLPKCKICSYVYTIVPLVHHTSQNSSDNLPSYPPGSQHPSDVVCGRVM